MWSFQFWKFCWQIIIFPKLPSLKNFNFLVNITCCFSKLHFDKGCEKRILIPINRFSHRCMYRKDMSPLCICTLFSPDLFLLFSVCPYNLLWNDSLYQTGNLSLLWFYHQFVLYIEIFFANKSFCLFKPISCLYFFFFLTLWDNRRWSESKKIVSVFEHQPPLFPVESSYQPLCWFFPLENLTLYHPLRFQFLNPCILTELLKHPNIYNVVTIDISQKIVENQILQFDFIWK